MMYGSHFNPLHLKLCKYSEYKINVVKQKERMLKLDGYGIFQKELIHILIFSCEFIKDAIFSFSVEVSYVSKNKDVFFYLYWYTYTCVCRALFLKILILSTFLWLLTILGSSMRRIQVVVLRFRGVVPSPSCKWAQPSPALPASPLHITHTPPLY